MRVPVSFNIYTRYLLDLKAKKKYPTPQDEASLQVKRNQLHARMQALEGVQGSYIHGVEALQSRISGTRYLVFINLNSKIAELEIQTSITCLLVRNHCRPGIKPRSSRN